ncbi:MAG TPA: helix-turn-helix domain-containing protein, partial [Amaricoccus sp.]|nr:helix-turn-helix domain-containing protein [Amaricoccus sp.]
MKTVKTASALLTTGEVAAYLRMKERTVYDMVARQQIPCSRATGKLLFSRPLIDAWVEAHTEMPAGRNAVVPMIYAGSSDPLLEWALRQSGCGLAVLATGSRRGLEAMARGEAMLAGVHLLDPGTGEYNVPCPGAGAAGRRGGDPLG